MSSEASDGLPRQEGHVGVPGSLTAQRKEDVKAEEQEKDLAEMEEGTEVMDSNKVTTETTATAIRTGTELLHRARQLAERHTAADIVSGLPTAPSTLGHPARPALRPHSPRSAPSLAFLNHHGKLHH